MADEQFYTILTNVGKAKITNAGMLGKSVVLEKIQAGDGGGNYYNPTEDQTTLKNKVWEGNINSFDKDENNPNWIIATACVPGSIGGFTVREMALIDNEGDMIAVCKSPETYKPKIGNGAMKDLYLKFIIEVSNVEKVTLVVDPTAIFLTKKDEEKIKTSITNLDKKITENNTATNKKIDDAKKDLGDKIGDTTLLETTDKTSLVNAVNELFQNVDNGKTLIASAITDRNINTSKNDTFKKMSDNIRMLEKYNNIPAISNIEVSNIKANGVYTLTYVCIDKDYDTLSHRVKIGNNNFIDITPLKNGDSYTYVGSGLAHSSDYTCYLEINDGKKAVVSSPFTISVPEAEIYGVQIDKSNSNPLTAVTYIEDAVGILPATPNGYGGWSNKYPFNQIKPCGFKDGFIYKYINPNDFTKYEDGTTVLEDVDVMIEFPKIYWNWVSVNNKYEIRISNVKIDENYICPAHSIGNVEKEKLYISAYLGFSLSGKLRSLKGQQPTQRETLDTFRKQAQANGKGYQQHNYYSKFMLQILFVIMYKSLDSQSSLGFGYYTGPNTHISTITGGTSSNGMNFGEVIGSNQMKFLGVEDLWGNSDQWLDGLCIDLNGNIMISDNSIFNDKGEGYIKYGTIPLKNAGYMSDIQAGSKTGFLPKAWVGSTTTYYTDSSSWYGEGVTIVGGSPSAQYSCGIFYSVGGWSPTHIDTVTSRLIYL